MSGDVELAPTTPPTGFAGRRSRRMWDAAAGAVASPDVLLLAPLVLTIVAGASIHPRLSAIAATALSFAIPLTLGMVAMAVSHRVMRGGRLRWGAVELGLAGALGLCALLALAQAQAATVGLSTTVLGVGTIVAGVATWIGLVVLDLVRPSPAASSDRQRRPDRHQLLGAAITVAIGLAVATWYRWDSPPPYHPQWDAFAHLRIIDRILDGVWSPWTTDYSATFRINAYFPLQQLTVAIAARLTDISPLAVYWGGPYIVMPLTSVLAYALARSVGVGWIAAALAGSTVVIAAFPFQALGQLGLLPLSLAVPFFSLALMAAGQTRSLRSRLVIASMLGLGAVAAHWYVGLAVVAFGVGVVLLREMEGRSRRFLPLVSLGIMAVAGVLLAGYAGVRLLPTDRTEVDDPEERAAVRTVSLAAREADFVLRLSPVIFAASAAGAGVLVARGARRPPDEPRVISTRVGRLTASYRPAPAAVFAVLSAVDRRGYVAAAWALTLAAAFLPVAGADRLFAALPAILVPTLAWSAQAGFDIARIPPPVTRRRGAAVVMVVVVALGLACLPADWFRSRQQAKAVETTYLSSFDPTELRAGEAIRSLTPDGSILISDPVGQEIIGGVADRESYGGGPFASDQQLAQLRAALGAKEAQTMWHRLRGLVPESERSGPLLVVVTGRTAEWLDLPKKEWWVGYHRRLAPFLEDPDSKAARLVGRLNDRRWFQPVWIGSDLVVFAVRPGRNAPIEGIAAPGTPNQGSPDP